MRIISGNAGIGKTTLLNKLAHNIKENEQNSNKWIVQLDLNKFTKKFEIMKEKLRTVDIRKVKQFLSIDLLNHKSLENLLFAQKFKQKDMIIFIDSFDSIAENKDYCDIILEIIKRIIKEKIGIFLATRTYNAEILKSSLPDGAYVLYNLEPLNDEQKDEYLKKKLKIPCNLLEKLKKNLDSNLNIMADPTLLSIVGKYCLKRQNDDADNIQLNSAELFKFIVDEKIRLYFEKKGQDQTNTYVDFDNVQSKMNIEKLRTDFAFNTFNKFKSNEFNELVSNHKYNSKYDKYLYLTGLINHDEEKPNIFDDYFIAMGLIFHLINSSNEEIKKLILEKILNQNGEFKSINRFMQDKFELSKKSMMRIILSHKNYSEPSIAYFLNHIFFKS